MSNSTRWYADSASLESDLREHAAAAGGSYAELTDLAAARCTPPTLRLLHVLYGIERSTIERMRQLLVTPTHSDAQVTAFLCTWAYERYWIADALSAILDHHGWATESRPRPEPVAPRPEPAAPRPGPVEGHRSRRIQILRRAQDAIAEARHRLLPITAALRTNLIGDSVVAVHLVEGVLSEALTRAAYRRLIMIEPSLSDVLELILRTKINHGRYFHTRAAVDLADSAAARRLVLRRLRRLSWPTPTDHLSASELDWFVTAIFGTDPGLLAGPAEEVGDLPGLARIRPVLDPVGRIRFRTGEMRS